MERQDSEGLDRRTLLLGAAGTMAAGGVAAGSGTAAAQEDDGEGGDGGGDGEDGGQEGEGGDGGGGGGGTETIMAGTSDQGQSFVPETIEVAPGTTVRWEWGTDNHNVSPQSQPDDADWPGHTDIESAGFEYEYTFEVLGTYEYQCDPHAPDMAGTIEVTENPSSGEEQATGGPPQLPGTALSVGVGLLAAMSSTMALAFFFLKYGGRPDEA